LGASTSDEEGGRTAVKVLIVGSKRHFAESDAARRAAFDQACRQMGKALAEKGHTLIVGTSDEMDADRYFVEGANEVPGKHKVIVYLPESDTRPTPFASEEQKFGKLEFAYRRLKGEWSVVHVHALREADVLIVLGGRKAALVAGGSAEALQKPVLALPSFEGAGKEVWDDVRRYYTSSGISADDQGALREAWMERTAPIAVRCAESLAKHNPLRPKGHGAQAVMMFVSLGLIAAWVALLNPPEALDKNFAFYPMLIIAALLGTSLRNTLRLVRAGPASFNAYDLWIEATAGVLIGFGFSLLYLAGSFVLTGNIVSLTDNTGFMRVAISMSILGFAGAFLLDEAATILRDRLTEPLKRTSNGK
jgi:hypothetical protein